MRISGFLGARNSFRQTWGTVAMPAGTETGLAYEAPEVERVIREAVGIWSSAYDEGAISSSAGSLAPFSVGITPGWIPGLCRFYLAERGHDGSRGALAHGEGTQKPGVAERRLKGSIGSSVQASLRDAHAFPHHYSVGSSPRLPSRSRSATSPIAKYARPRGSPSKHLVPREGVGNSPR